MFDLRCLNKPRCQAPEYLHCDHWLKHDPNHQSLYHMPNRHLRLSKHFSAVDYLQVQAICQFQLHLFFLVFLSIFQHSAVVHKFLLHCFDQLS